MKRKIRIYQHIEKNGTILYEARKWPYIPIFNYIDDSWAMSFEDCEKKTTLRCIEQLSQPHLSWRESAKTTYRS